MRPRNIMVWKSGGDECCFCGKSTARRKGKSPAPISIVFEFKSAVFRNHFSHDNPEITPGQPQVGVPMVLARTGWELATNLRIGGAVCMTCAKRISSRFDVAIDQIESSYQRKSGPTNRRPLSCQGV